MDLDEGLRNWGRCMRGGIKRGQCGSAEGNYRSNWRQWLSLSDIPHTEHCDTLEAERYEAAWSGMQDHREKHLLKLVYVWRMRVTGFTDTDGKFKPGICNKLRITESQYHATLSRARYHIKLALDKSKDLCKTITKFNPLPEKVEAQTAL